MHSFLALGIVTVQWVLFGYSLAFGPDRGGVIGGLEYAFLQGVLDKLITSDERVVCVLTGHPLKDPTATVAYHAADREQFDRVLGSRGVRRAAFANRAVVVPNDLEEIIKAIRTNE